MSSSSMRSLSGSRTGSRASTTIGGLNERNGTKSTVFHPLSMSTMSRYDIVDHMNSHYKRINGAKATVDTTPPKSYLTHRSPSPGSTRTNSRASSATRHSKDVIEIDERQREAIVRTSSRINFYLDALRLEQQRLLSQVTSQNVPFRRSVTNTAIDAKRPKCRLDPPPDLIDRHSEQFTKSDRLFVPRLLRTTATSRLREYRWYNSPKRREKRRESDDDTGTELTFEDSNINHSSNEPRDDSDDDRLAKTSDLDSDRHSARSYVVNRDPPRSRSGSKEVIVRPSIDDRKSNGREVDLTDGQYLQFVVDVTNDVLARGIYTNKVLKQVFRNHVDKRSNELNVAEMEKILKKLRDDLGISDDEEGNTAAFGYGQRKRGGHTRSIDGMRRGDENLELSNGRSTSKWSPSTQTKDLRETIEEQQKGTHAMTASSPSSSRGGTSDADEGQEEYTRQRLHGLNLEDDDESNRFFDEDNF